MPARFSGNSELCFCLTGRKDLIAKLVELSIGTNSFFALINELSIEMTQAVEKVEIKSRN